MLALYKRATKKRSLFCSFKKSENEQKMSDFQVAHFSLKKERLLIIYMNKCWAIAQLLICSIAHRSFLKEQLCNRSLICSFKKSE